MSACTLCKWYDKSLSFCGLKKIHIIDNSDECKSFNFKEMNKTDKVLELVTAFKNNQPVEYFISGEWIKVEKVDTILEYCLHGYSIRIKPAPKYRSYKTLEEFLFDKNTHGPGLHPEYDKKMMFFPQRVSGEGKYVSLDAEAYKTLSFDKMVNTPWVWEDGKVCGIEIE